MPSAKEFQDQIAALGTLQEWQRFWERLEAAKLPPDQIGPLRDAAVNRLVDILRRQIQLADRWTDTPKILDAWKMSLSARLPAQASEAIFRQATRKLGELIRREIHSALTMPQIVEVIKTSFSAIFDRSDCEYVMRVGGERLRSLLAQSIRNAATPEEVWKGMDLTQSALMYIGTSGEHDDDLQRWLMGQARNKLSGDQAVSLIRTELGGANTLHKIWWTLAKSHHLSMIPPRRHEIWEHAKSKILAMVDRVLGGARNTKDVARALRELGCLEPLGVTFPTDGQLGVYAKYKNEAIQGARKRLGEVLLERIAHLSRDDVEGLVGILGSSCWLTLEQANQLIQIVEGLAGVPYRVLWKGYS